MAALSAAQGRQSMDGHAMHTVWILHESVLMALRFVNWIRSAIAIPSWNGRSQWDTARVCWCVFVLWKTHGASSVVLD